MSSSNEAVEMFVGGLVMDPSTQAPIVLLQDQSGEVTLPIWIGVAEATSIASAIKQVTMVRPLTHDLFFEFLLEMNSTVDHMTITDLKDSTYYSELVLRQGDRVIVLDARPSDAIAMTLRASAPIYVAVDVLKQAQAAIASGGGRQSDSGPDEGSAEGEQGSGEGATGEAPSEGDEGEEPRHADQRPLDLQSMNKQEWEKILAELDEDDFKYKM